MLLFRFPSFLQECAHDCAVDGFAAQGEEQLAEAARRDTLSQSVAESREMSHEIAAPRQENVENPAENSTGEIEHPRDSSNCVAECRKLSHGTAHSREETSEIPAKNAEIAVVRQCDNDDTECDTARDTADHRPETGSTDDEKPLRPRADGGT